MHLEPYTANHHTMHALCYCYCVRVLIIINDNMYITSPFFYWLMQKCLISLQSILLDNSCSR